MALRERQKFHVSTDEPLLLCPPFVLVNGAEGAPKNLGLILPRSILSAVSVAHDRSRARMRLLCRDDGFCGTEVVESFLGKAAWCSFSTIGRAIDTRIEPQASAAATLDDMWRTAHLR